MKIKSLDFAKIFVFAFLITFLCMLLVVSDAAGSETYEYEKKDVAQEQKKFIAKLKEDRKKCEMAIENTPAGTMHSRSSLRCPFRRVKESLLRRCRFSRHPRPTRR